MQPADPPAAETSIWSLIVGAQAKNWSRILVRDHASPQARLALFQTCRDGKDLVLGAAEHASMVPLLAASEDQPDLPLSMASMHAVKSALLTRGNHPTKLHLTATSLPLLDMAVTELHTCTTWLHEVVVDVAEHCLPTAALAALARTCPNLRALGVTAMWAALPSPELFPHLKALSLHSHDPGSEEVIMHTTAPYLKHLTSLTITTSFLLTEPRLLLLLAPAGGTGVNLRTLHINTTLNDTLLGLLLACTPALTHLKVDQLLLSTTKHAQVAAAWRELHVMGQMPVSSLSRLPLAADMKLILGEVIMCDVSTAQAASEVMHAVMCFREVAVQQSIGEAALQGTRDVAVQGIRSRVVLLAPENVHVVSEYCTALRVGTSLLRACTTTNPNAAGIALFGWIMIAAVVLELQGLPSWGELGLCVKWCDGLLQHYNTLLHLLPDSFCDVCIDHVPGLTREHYECICLGAPRDRTSEAPLHIRLQGCEPASIAAAVQQQMQQLGVYPNVGVGYS